MTAKLYAMVQSHPALAARLALEQAGVDHQVRNILPGLHGPAVRAAGFPRSTVPALRIDGRRVQGSLAIARELDRLAPDAGLFPHDPEARRAVEAAERWGHDELQPLARRVFVWGQAHTSAVRTWMVREVMRLPAPSALGAAFRPTMTFLARHVYGATDDAVRADLARLPGLLAHADGLLETGTIGREPRTAADFQILTSLRLLLAHADLRPLVERRRCGRAALALIPDYPSGPEALPPIPSALPDEWLERGPAAPAG